MITIAKFHKLLLQSVPRISTIFVVVTVLNYRVIITVKMLFKINLFFIKFLKKKKIKKLALNSIFYPSKEFAIGKFMKAYFHG